MEYERRPEVPGLSSEKGIQNFKIQWKGMCHESVHLSIHFPTTCLQQSNLL